MSRYIYKEGEEVVHIANRNQVMFVSEIKKKKIKLKDGTILNKMIGIEVHWYQDGEYKKDKFHSRLLIPNAVIKLGEEQIQLFINSNSYLQ